MWNDMNGGNFVLRISQEGYIGYTLQASASAFPVSEVAHSGKN